MFLKRQGWRKQTNILKWFRKIDRAHGNRQKQERAGAGGKKQHRHHRILIQRILFENIINAKEKRR